MSQPPIIARPSLKLEDEIRLMFTYKIKKLIIVQGEENKKLVGLVTLTDIARIEPYIIDVLKSLFEEAGEAPPKRIEKVMNYYIV